MKTVLECRFYSTVSGVQPVREWLKTLPSDVRKEIGSDIQTVQFQWPIGKPLIDAFGDGLFEVRTKVQGNIYRVIFCINDGAMILLNGFQKKTQKTPQSELALAKKRQKSLES
jgi:hypothetical protein